MAGDGGTDASEVYGLSKSDDQGYSWETCLEGERLFNVTFDGETVYAVGETGLFKSENGGENWTQYPQIVDEEQSLSVYTDEYYSVA
ncbi:hypothetical protein KAH55_04280, partial [bacterium]|nr:hypothetical protein [bacterium]